MAVYGMSLNPDDDGPLRPSDGFWKQVNAMHRIDADAEQSVFQAAFEERPERRPGYDVVRDVGHRSHTDNGRDRQSKPDWQEIFDHAFPRFQDED
jgi:hypothetical protein